MPHGRIRAARLARASLDEGEVHAHPRAATTPYRFDDGLRVVRRPSDETHRAHIHTLVVLKGGERRLHGRRPWQRRLGRSRLWRLASGSDGRCRQLVQRGRSRIGRRGGRTRRGRRGRCGRCGRRFECDETLTAPVTRQVALANPALAQAGVPVDGPADARVAVGHLEYLDLHVVVHMLTGEVRRVLRLHPQPRAVGKERVEREDGLTHLEGFLDAAGGSDGSGGSGGNSSGGGALGLERRGVDGGGALGVDGKGAVAFHVRGEGESHVEGDVGHGHTCAWVARYSEGRHA